MDIFLLHHIITLVLAGAAFPARSLTGTSASAPVVTKVCGGYETAVASTL